MTETIALHDYLAAREIPESVDRDWLIATILTPLGIEPGGHLADLCEDIILGATADSTGGELHMRPGGWRINLAASLVRATISAAIVGAGLVAIGADQIPLLLLPAVLPLLIDLERVELDLAERELLIPLRQACIGIEGIAVQPQVLYNRLEPGVRAQLNYYDFVAYLDRLTKAGELDNAGLGEVRPRAPGAPAWLRLTWK
ncbi:MAG: hypothetical protein ACOYEV_10515 [Candidatus Nanopelagicales bacterium]